MTGLISDCDSCIMLSFPTPVRPSAFCCMVLSRGCYSLGEGMLLMIADMREFRLERSRPSPEASRDTVMLRFGSAEDSLLL